MSTKVCSKCGVEKELGEFHKSQYNSRKSLWCKSCKKKYRAEYIKEWWKINKEKINEYNRKYYGLYRKSEKNKEYQREYHYEYCKSGKRLKYQRVYSKNVRLDCKDSYIKKSLKKSGFSQEIINDCPELIEVKRLIIKTKRLCKTSAN